jgi:hypothetical protein
MLVWMPMKLELLICWRDAYRFAIDVLGYGDGEAVEYANLRYCELQNRELLAERARTLEVASC